MMFIFHKTHIIYIYTVFLNYPNKKIPDNYYSIWYLRNKEVVEANLNTVNYSRENPCKREKFKKDNVRV